MTMATFEPITAEGKLVGPNSFSHLFYEITSRPPGCLQISNTSGPHSRGSSDYQI